MKEKAIEVKSLVKVYKGGVVAVDCISFDVNKGELFAFLGPNGAGKTTTIEVLEGLRTPTRGFVRVLGYDVTKSQELKAMKKRIGVLPQEFCAVQKLTVKENLKFFSSLYEKSADLEELLDVLDLKDVADRRFEKLSGGLKQRVGVATALVSDPELLFLDEPTTGLDPKSRRDVWNVLKRLKNQGKTIFLTTHYMEEAQALADRVAIIVKGRLAAIGSPYQLITRYGGKRLLLVRRAKKEVLDGLKARFSSTQVKDEEARVSVEDAKSLSEVMNFMTALQPECEVEVKTPSLEDVFLRLLGAKISEEGELA